MFALISLTSGLIFGLGLAVSEMANPTVVLGFLNIFGEWNPSLIFVMVGAISVGLCAYRVQKRLAKPLFFNDWSIPKLKQIDSKLILGASLFGIGWGLSGYCPGPGLTAIANNSAEAIYFVSALIAGSALHFVQTKVTN
ncbi:YeeE/YedE family protein [Marinomonas sp. C2222]|uniref:YeeE/YedE family protein n=1 Tax=Marinomonas sargassi TaxID=2984494 RepID=A0ABT2YS95_9GAMM|nr:DUF6691 family protein [Marinomonas sargassi]MCV2402759.1 YeeE/YedE family protein [Marinomonas sargassi]